jgi:hypothetical protein
MKDESSARANDVLRSVRGSADPQPEDQLRVLARLEQRLGMRGALEQRQPAPPRRVNAWVRRPAKPAGGRWPLPRVLASLPGVGILAAFGVSMAAIGYGLGTRARDTSLEDTGRISSPAALTRSELPPAARSAAPALLPAPAHEGAAAHESAATPTRPAARTAVPPPAVSEPLRARRAGTRRGVEASESAPPPAAVAPEASPIQLREALQLLERAQTAVRLGTAGDALDWLARLERRNPGPLLEQERLVTRALALCALGEVTQAREARRQLEALEPASIYGGQLDASCAKKE